jgi:hypothetical protein
MAHLGLFKLDCVGREGTRGRLRPHHAGPMREMVQEAEILRKPPVKANPQCYALLELFEIQGVKRCPSYIFVLISNHDVALPHSISRIMQFQLKCGCEKNVDRSDGALSSKSSLETRLERMQGQSTFLRNRIG